MDLNIILTVVLAVVGLLISIAGLNFVIFSWLRSDMRAFEDKIDSWKDDVAKESKDFHGRLCALEEKYWNLRDEREKKEETK